MRDANLSTDQNATPGDAAPTVRHEPDRKRFVVKLGDEQTAMAEYERNGRTIVFTHTEVPPEHEGQGIGAALAKAGLEHARAEGLSVIPQCHFIAGYVQQHEEYQELVPEEWRRAD